MNKEDILEEALRITSGDRQAHYGPPDQDFARTAAMWSALFGDKLSSPFEARDVAMAMICLKLSRETHQRKRDNSVDGAGYFRCLHLCNEAAAAKEEKLKGSLIERTIRAEQDTWRIQNFVAPNTDYVTVEKEQVRGVGNKTWLEVNMPDGLPPLPAPPDGYNVWVYRGLGWKNRDESSPILYLLDRTRQWEETPVASGVPQTHYAEALKQ